MARGPQPFACRRIELGHARPIATPRTQELSHALSPLWQDRPLRLRALPRDDDVRRQGLLGGCRKAREPGGRVDRGRCTRCRGQLRRHGRRLLRGSVGDPAGRRARIPQASARAGHRRDQGPRTQRARPEPDRPIPVAHSQLDRRESAPAAPRLRGPLPDSRGRQGHPHRRDVVRSGKSATWASRTSRRGSR